MKITLSKISAIVILFSTTAHVSAQVGEVVSAKYGWSEAKGSERNVLKGNTTYFAPLEVDIVTLAPGKLVSANTPTDVEELMIMKEGSLEIAINGGKKKVIGPGSIAYIMPAEKYSNTNTGNTKSVFYRLRFKSKFPVETGEGKSNGGSFIVDWDSLVMKGTERGGRRDFFNRPTSTTKKFEMHVTTLNEGLPSHDPHTHPEEEIILLIKGTATMQVDKKSYEMSPGDFVFAASGDLHGIRNSGKGQCEYFAFQWK